MATSKVEKLEIDVPIKASAEEFHDLLCGKTHQVSNITPQKVQSVEILEGDWGTQGSITFWKYVHDGKACVAKQVIEAIDKENLTITFKVLEGDLLEEYKSFKFIMHVVPQKEGSVVHWTIEYEKLKDHIPNPHSLLHLQIEAIKDIDAHLVAPKQN